MKFITRQRYRYSHRKCQYKRTQENGDRAAHQLDSIFKRVALRCKLLSHCWNWRWLQDTTKDLGGRGGEL